MTDIELPEHEAAPEPEAHEAAPAPAPESEPAHEAAPASAAPEKEAVLTIEEFCRRISQRAHAVLPEIVNGFYAIAKKHGLLAGTFDEMKAKLQAFAAAPAGETGFETKKPDA